MQALLNWHIISVQQIFKLKDTTPVIMTIIIIIIIIIIVIIIIVITKDYCIQLHIIQMYLINLKKLTLHFHTDLCSCQNNSSQFSWTSKLKHKLSPC